MFERRQQGQVSILFALLLPIFILFCGLTLDLGWYYLNVQRLQNAADAAAVAGARSLVDSENFSGYKNVKLVGKYPAKDSNKYRVDNIRELTALENSNVIANEYVAKNLSSNKDTIINSWTKTEVQTDKGLYEKDDNLYYVVRLKEEIRHFFLPGWFDDMTAPVTAVALLSKTNVKDVASESDDPTPSMPGKPSMPFFEDIVLDEDMIKEMEELKNSNVIIGNWEVQNYYRIINDTNGSSGTKELVDDDGKVQKVKLTRAEEYSKIYTTDYDKSIGITREVYVSAWNMFQDYKVHFKSGKPIRYETIDIFDDVKLVNPNLTGADRYANSNMYSYGKTGNGDVQNPSAKGSSVQNTKASGNSLDTSSYTYNSGGNPYVWQDLDSIDIDFQPEVSWDRNYSVYPLQDWDLKFGYDKWSNKWYDGSGNSNVGVGAIEHNKYNNDGSEQSATEKGGWSDHLRIHSYINFKTPYRRILRGRLTIKLPTFYGCGSKASRCSVTPTAKTRSSK